MTIKPYPTHVLIVYHPHLSQNRQKYKKVSRQQNRPFHVNAGMGMQEREDDFVYKEISLLK